MAFNDLPRMHPRHIACEEAKRELGGPWMEIIKKHNLTPIEQVQILTQEIQSALKWAIRFERHGEYETPGDIEKE